jgi:hypothetical protein
MYVARHINSIVIDLYSVFSDFPKTVGPSIYVLPDIRSDIYFEIVGPTAFLSGRTDGLTVFGKSGSVL